MSASPLHSEDIWRGKQQLIQERGKQPLIQELITPIYNFVKHLDNCVSDQSRAKGIKLPAVVGP